MSIKLFIQAIFKFLLGVGLVGILIFVPAGTLSYYNAWFLMGILFIPMFAAGVVMMFKNPKLLAKRLNGKENQREQSLVVKLSGLMFIAGFIVCGLDFRLGWSEIAQGISIAAAVFFLAAYLLYAEVLRENEYLSRTIEVQENQKVIDTGLYGIVRHPMYSITLILFISMPLILGSLYALPVFLLYPLIIVKRIRNEEALLAEELTGYRDYMKRVRFRLIPFVW